MTSTKQSRPAGNGTAQETAAWTAAPILQDAADDATPTRPRCLRCHHPLTTPRSVSRAYGPRCWTRTALVQINRRRDDVGRRLGALARLVARADARAVALVAARLAELVEALRDEGVAL